MKVAGIIVFVFNCLLALVMIAICAIDYIASRGININTILTAIFAVMNITSAAVTKVIITNVDVTKS